MHPFLSQKLQKRTKHKQKRRQDLCAGKELRAGKEELLQTRLTSCWSVVKEVIDDHKVDVESLPIGKEYALGAVDAALQKTMWSSRGILLKSSNAAILIAVSYRLYENDRRYESCWSRWSGVRSKRTHFCLLEGKSYLTVGTRECTKVHHCHFWCLLPVDAGEVKPGNLLEMAHILAKQRCYEQAYTISQRRLKNTNGWAGKIRHRGQGRRQGGKW